MGLPLSYFSTFLLHHLVGVGIGTGTGIGIGWEGAIPLPPHSLTPRAGGWVEKQTFEGWGRGDKDVTVKGVYLPLPLCPPLLSRREGSLFKKRSCASHQFSPSSIPQWRGGSLYKRYCPPFISLLYPTIKGEGEVLQRRGCPSLANPLKSD